MNNLDRRSNVRMGELADFDAALEIKVQALELSVNLKIEKALSDFKATLDEFKRGIVKDAAKTCLFRDEIALVTTPAVSAYREVALFADQRIKPFELYDRGKLFMSFRAFLTEADNLRVESQHQFEQLLAAWTISRGLYNEQCKGTFYFRQSTEY